MNSNLSDVGPDEASALITELQNALQAIVDSLHGPLNRIPIQQALDALAKARGESK